jgi:hypothetical protein
MEGGREGERERLKPLCDLLVQGEFVDGRLEGGVTVCLSDCVCVSLSVTDARFTDWLAMTQARLWRGGANPCCWAFPSRKRRMRAGSLMPCCIGSCR